ncbi:hypothetical protein CBOM_07657 [Ceraceosorus bombacis]|uniref:Uncharacterized protein n=1 Tax=Ceraceosorus bombacis TaxID=401625 RepID=A0A0N7LAP5_9BASI|nr:hypothetical protein CBOM_07657 [Ceraceosorus bombacis]
MLRCSPPLIAATSRPDGDCTSFNKGASVHHGSPRHPLQASESPGPLARRTSRATLCESRDYITLQAPDQAGALQVVTLSRWMTAETD